MERQEVKLVLRLPEALHHQLTFEAKRAVRSLNSEILWRLGMSVAEQWGAPRSPGRRPRRLATERVAS
jgi:Arc-like DNA binding domain